MGRVSKNSKSKAVETLLELFESNRKAAGPVGSSAFADSRPALPLMVGAGVSVSAGVPLNASLLDTISKQKMNNTPELKYEKIYDYIGEKFSNGYQKESFIKSDLRDWLIGAGIPRERDDPLPNLSNLLLVHLLSNSFLGPIISLNVDPLLQVSRRFFPRAKGNVGFIQNSSQFSDLLHSNPGENSNVYQPHGTIEEPLSLRFTKDELLDKENDLRQALSSSLKGRYGFATLGVNLEDGVAVELITDWATDNKSRRLELVTLHHGKIKPKELDNLKVLVSKNHAPNVNVRYFEDVDSDELLSELAKVAFKRTAINRANSETLYHVSSIAELSLQHRLFQLLSEDKTGAQPGFGNANRLPDPSTWLIIKIALFAIQCRSPFRLGDLVRYCSEFGAFDELFASSAGMQTFTMAVKQLVRSELIVVDGADAREIRDIDLTKYQNIFDIERIFLKRNPFLKTALDFVNMLMSDILRMDVNGIKEISNMLEGVELEREVNFDFSRALSANLYFDRSSVLTTHQELDVQLDSVKEEFLSRSKGDLKTSCMVITESGEHLFRNDEINEIGSSDDVMQPDFDVARCLRDWVQEAYLRETGGPVTLRIIVARKDESWTFERSDRTERDKIIKNLILRINERPNIDVLMLLWDKHDDHMWLLNNDRSDASKGVVFPRAHGEYRSYGLRVDGIENVNKLSSVFEKHWREAVPVTVDEVNWVVALTIVDDATCLDGCITDDTKILIGVRDPKNNKQHAKIACVPTKRVPKSIFSDIVDGGYSVSAEGNHDDLLNRDWVTNGRKSGHDPVIDVVENIMSRKLGLADALEEGTLTFSATPRVVISDFSPVYSASDEPEYVAMLNIIVRVKKGVKLFQTSTPSYSRMAWFAAGEFLAAARGDVADTLNFESGVGDVEYKCGGVCVCTSRAVISEMKKDR